MTREWVSASEASLLMSIRSPNPGENTYVTRQDIVQQREQDKIAAQDMIIPGPRKPILYRAETMRTYPITKTLLYTRSKYRTEVRPGLYKKKWGEQTFPIEVVAYWLETFPDTIADLKAKGYHIPHEEEAKALLQKHPTPQPMGFARRRATYTQKQEKKLPTPHQGKRTGRTHAEYPSEMREQAMALYNDGHSFPEVTRRLNEARCTQVSEQTIRNWVQKVRKTANAAS